MGTQPQLSPLEQLEQQPQAASSSQDELSPLERLEQSGPQTPPDPSQTGEITNDVGQKVIVPKDGEAFSDTLKRAVAYHKSLTPEQTQSAMDAEMKTAPTKAVQTLGAAAGIGVAGPALLAMPGEIGEMAIKHLAGNVLPGMETEAAKQTLMQALPKAVSFAKTMGELGLGAGGVAYLLKSLLGDSKK